MTTNKTLPESQSVEDASDSSAEIRIQNANQLAGETALLVQKYGALMSENPPDQILGNNEIYDPPYALPGEH
jgi:hypothetical protein